jgi:hypothetical protein
MGVPSLVFAVPPEGGFTSGPHSTAYPHRSDTSPQTSHSASPAVGLQETWKMLPKSAALSQSPRGGLPRRPLSLPGLKAGVSRGKSR